MADALLVAVRDGVVERQLDSPGEPAGSVLPRGSAKYSDRYSMPQAPKASYWSVVRTASNRGTGTPSEVARLEEVDRVGHALVGQAPGHRGEVTGALARESQAGGTEGSVPAGDVTDPEQFEIGLAPREVAAGPDLPARTGRRADLEVGEATCGWS